jgi:membrane-associated protein
MRVQILAALSQYGSPVLFVVAAIASVGVPLPVTLLLIVAGSLVAQGIMPVGWAIAMASAGAVTGDQIGYAIGRFGGTALVRKFGGLLGGHDKLAEAEARARRWGWAGIFFSRWLMTPLGSLINFGCGIAEYSWVRFTVWDVLGEVLGAVIFIGMGRTFSDRVLALSDLMGDLAWAVVALVAAVGLGWMLWRVKRKGPQSRR